MEKNFSRAIKLGLIVLFGALLEQAGGTKYLWVFPLVFPGLGIWLLFVCADTFLSSLRFPAVERARLLLWGSGILYFSARSGFPLVGMFLLFAPACLWILSRGEMRVLLRAALPLLAVMFLLGHDSRFYHWQLQSEAALGWRFSIHLIAIFAFFRALSWLAVVAGRGERPGFLLTMEYFLAPVFWLSPLHASHLLFARMEPTQSNEGKAYLWIVRGFFHALCLTLVCRFALPWLGALFGGGLRGVHWYEWLVLGPVLFAISYLDKSQVSYFVAGFLRISGRNIEPDFRAPWLAKDLLDYWRRFHYWLWEYYMDIIYPYFLLPLSRRMSPERALPLAIFFAFTMGTGAGHFLSYRAGLLASFALASVFGLATLIHYFIKERFKSKWLGIPFTWVTIFLLYILAYPVIGLGWGLSEFLVFFRS